MGCGCRFTGDWIVSAEGIENRRCRRTGFTSTTSLLLRTGRWRHERPRDASAGPERSLSNAGSPAASSWATTVPLVGEEVVDKSNELSTRATRTIRAEEALKAAKVAYLMDLMARGEAAVRAGADQPGQRPPEAARLRAHRRGGRGLR